MESILYMVPVAGVIALVYAFIKNNWINKQSPGNEKNGKNFPEYS